MKTTNLVHAAKLIEKKAAPVISVMQGPAGKVVTVAAGILVDYIVDKAVEMIEEKAGI